MFEIERASKREKFAWDRNFCSRQREVRDREVRDRESPMYFIENRDIFYWKSGHFLLRIGTYYIENQDIFC